MKRWMLLTVWMMWSVWLLPAGAQDAVASPEAETVSAVEPAEVSAVSPGVEAAVETVVVPAAGERLTLRQVLENGGGLMWVLAGMSVVAVALILYFLFALNTGRVTPAGFLRDVEVMLEQGRFEEALALCGRDRSPAARIVQAAVQYVERAGEPDADLLRQLVEGEGIRQAGRLQSQISYLMDIGVIAPMVGLLGTVMGMLTSFSAVALDIHKARPMELANGVSQALVTTAAGLVVAIPAMVFYSLFRGRLNKCTGSMELAATQVVTILAHRKADV